MAPREMPPPADRRLPVAPTSLQDHHRPVFGGHGRPGSHLLPSGEPEVQCSLGMFVCVMRTLFSLSTTDGMAGSQGLHSDRCRRLLGVVPQIVHPAIWSIIVASFRFLLRHCGEGGGAWASAMRVSSANASAQAAVQFTCAGIE